MCKVIQFRFTCGHCLKFRRSECRGKYHKISHDSVKVACTADSYIIINMSFKCGTCQQIEWDTPRKQKLERAKTFLAGLSEKSLPGEYEILQLVKGLEDDYNAASWNVRNMFPHTYKPSIGRVKLKDWEEMPSPLSHEVQPGDVILPENRRQEVHHDDDDDYMISTDPFHPVTTDYSHPLDNMDRDWLLDYLTPEERASDGIGVGFDASAADWTWEADDTYEEYWHKANDWNSCGENSNDEASELTAWGPNKNMQSSSIDIGLEGANTKEKREQEQVEKVIEAFWHCVNSDDRIEQPHQSPSHPDKVLSSLCHKLNISGADNFSFTSKSLSSAQIWTDRICEQPPLLMKSPTIKPPAVPPSPDSTRSKFDKMRRQLQASEKKYMDRRVYYTKWLLVARMEIRQFEGPGGRYIEDPKPIQKKGFWDDCWKTQR